MEIKENTYKGTRILFNKIAKKKRRIIDRMIDVVELNGFKEIIVPIIQKKEIFVSKVGEENQNMMYEFKDRGNRDLVLAPEYTAVIQMLGASTFKRESDVMLFYIGECFRGEKPQMGRYRQFTQFGVEILNPTKDYNEFLIAIAKEMIEIVTKKYLVNTNATRGLDYYKNGKGFEISCEELGNSKQVCGGGEYSNGVGFAIGVDRLLKLIRS